MSSLKEVVAVVGGELHRDGAGGLLGGGAVQKGGESQETDHLREKCGYQLLLGWLYDQVLCWLVSPVEPPALRQAEAPLFVSDSEAESVIFPT